MNYSYPLHIQFKILSFAPQTYVTDSGGNELLFVHQKFLKLKEDVRVYSNSSKERELYTIKADRIIDFNAHYEIVDSQTNLSLGSIQREGMTSLVRASYAVKDPGGNTVFEIRETNPWVKVFDFLVEIVPFAGLLTGFIFHPKYAVYDRSNREILTLVKKASFFESSYDITLNVEDLGDQEERFVVLSLMMIVLLQRSTG